MDVQTLLSDNTWMTDEEKKRAGEFAEAFADLFEKSAVVSTLLVCIRAADIIALYFHVARIESRLLEVASAASADAKRGATVEDILEAAGKARERLRKAVKELEEYCSNAGTPIDKGLAGIMRPILKKAEGVYEDALQFEGRKKARKHAAAKRGSLPAETPPQTDVACGAEEVQSPQDRLREVTR